MLEHIATAASASRVEDAVRIDTIGALESLKAAAGAAQARVEIAFRDSQIAQQRDQGVARNDLGRGVADQIGLARRISPKHASDQLALRRVLIEALPQTTDLLARGEISEWAAHEVAKNVLVLDDEDRAAVDAELADQLPSLTASRAGRAAKKRAQEIDPAAAVKRAAQAVSDRRVSIRPAPDTMVNLTALLPVAEGVAAFAALDRHAKALRGAGDPRGRGQIMADALVERVTGQADAGEVSVEVQLLMTDTTLLAGGDEAALLEGHLVPGAVARHLALGALPGTSRRPARYVGTSDSHPNAGSPATELTAESAPRDVRRWVRRLYTDPVTGELAAVDPRRRLFSGALRRFIQLRDQDCRTPWCDAPIRHLDHVTRHADGGATDATNGVGVCERFNHVKEMPGWHTQATADGGAPGAGPDPESSATLTVTTPTGHVYTSRPPALTAPAQQRTRQAPSPVTPSPPATPPTPPAVSAPRRIVARRPEAATDLDDLPATSSRLETELICRLSTIRRQ